LNCKKMILLIKLIEIAVANKKLSLPCLYLIITG
jgi:hypothetical protein